MIFATDEGIEGWQSIVVLFRWQAGNGLALSLFESQVTVINIDARGLNLVNDRKCQQREPEL